MMATRRTQVGGIAAENVNVKIMGRDYAFACAPEEKESLLECVALVDGKMNAIKAMGKLTAIERIAVMAALTIANEFKAEKAAPRTQESKQVTEDTKELISGLDSAAMKPRIESLNQEIEEFLAEQAKRVNMPQPPLFE
jgi:cell division protein ZapA